MQPDVSLSKFTFDDMLHFSDYKTFLGFMVIKEIKVLHAYLMGECKISISNKETPFTHEKYSIF